MEVSSSKTEEETTPTQKETTPLAKLTPAIVNQYLTEILATSTHPASEVSTHLYPVLELFRPVPVREHGNHGAKVVCSSPLTGRVLACQHKKKKSIIWFLNWFFCVFSDHSFFCNFRLIITSTASFQASTWPTFATTNSSHPSKFTLVCFFKVDQTCFFFPMSKRKTI